MLVKTESVVWDMEGKRTGGKPVMLAVLSLVFEVWAWMLLNNNSGNNVETTLLDKIVDRIPRIFLDYLLVICEEVDVLVAV